MEDSIFTKIIKGEIPCHKVYEDDKIDLLWDLPDDDYVYLWRTARKIAQRMGEVLGRRIGVHVEGIGVPHAHIHLVPFDTTEEFLRHPDMAKEPDHQALAAIAERLAF
jgi:histidine triad (HIT) family protein